MRRSAASRKAFRDKLDHIRARFEANPISYYGSSLERAPASPAPRKPKPPASRRRAVNKIGSGVDIVRPDFLGYYLDSRGRLRPRNLGVTRPTRSEGSSIIPRDAATGGPNEWWPSIDTSKLSDDALIPRPRKSNPPKVYSSKYVTFPSLTPKLQRSLHRSMERKKLKITQLREKILSNPKMASKMKLFVDALDEIRFRNKKSKESGEKNSVWEKGELLAANTTIVDLQYSLVRLLLQWNRLKRMTRLNKKVFPGFVAVHRTNIAKKIEDARLLAEELLVLKKMKK